MPDSFANRIALVTGAASGIGLAVAQHLTDHGAKRLVLTDIDAAALARIDVGCTVDLVPGDVRDEAFWDALAPRLGGLDHAVVNAGAAGAGTIADLAFNNWRRILSVNLDGAFLTIRAAMRAMKERGGSIVAISGDLCQS